MQCSLRRGYVVVCVGVRSVCKLLNGRYMRSRRQGRLHSRIGHCVQWRGRTVRWRHLLLSLWQSPVCSVHRRIYLRSRRQTIVYYHD